MPTPAGWRLLAAGIIAVVAGRAFALVELYVVGAAAMVAVVAALFVRLVHPSRLSVDRRVTSTMVAVAEPVEVRLEISNRSALVSPTVQVHERVSAAGDVRFNLAPLAGRSAASGSYRLAPERRGILEVGPAVVSDIDGLGLARRRHRLGDSTRVVVHPLVETLVSPKLPVGGDLSLPTEFHRRTLGLESSEFDVLRPYAAGDDPRHIHWKSTARLGEFMVSRFQPSRPGRLTVVIDTRPPGDAASVQDRTTSVAASIVSSVLRAGDEARILTTDGRGTPVLQRRSDVAVALEFLALLAGGRPSIDVETLDGGSVVVAVTANADAMADDGVRHGLAQRLRASLVVTYGTDGHGDAAPAADADSSWIHLTGPGQLPGLWPLVPLSGHRSPVRA